MALRKKYKAVGYASERPRWRQGFQGEVVITVSVDCMCGVNGQCVYSARKENVMKAQVFADPGLFLYMAPKGKITELNPSHPAVKEILSMEERAGEEGRVTGHGHLIYDTAQIKLRYLMQENTDYAKQMYQSIEGNIWVDADAPRQHRARRADNEYAGRR